MKTGIRSILMLLVVFAVAHPARAQLTADFTTSAIAGCSPLVVYFTNTTTPSTTGVTFSWDLGLGGTPVPTVDASSSYITPGTYTITLTATSGGHTSTHSVVVTVYPSPTVSFTASPRSVCPGAPVTFTSTSTPGVPGGMTYLWSFGDGGTGAASPMSHSYSAAGVYNITLSVTNSDGCETSFRIPSYVTVNPVPAPSFTAPVTHFCHPPGHAVFTGSATGASPFTYTWRFGDGSPSSTGASPSHDYSLTGTYNVTLIATDSRGCTDSLTVRSYISVVNFGASFTGPSTVCIGSTATFVNTSTTHGLTTWTFTDDGSTYGLDPGVHTFGRAGSWRVKLYVSDGICSDTTSRPITVLNGPAASFTQSPPHPCPPPTTVAFTATVPSGTVVTWLYGDGGSGAGTSVSHTYSGFGIDSVKMISRDPTTGCVDTVVKLDTFYNLIPKLTASPVNGCKPLPVNFSIFNQTSIPSGLRPYPYPIATYSWDFGDGSSVSSAPSPSHTYTAIGTYHVTVTETTTNGCTVTDTVTINVGAPPVVTFTATPTRECYHNNSITFTASVLSGPLDSLDWFFGDGNATTTTLGVSHTYIKPGIYTVTIVPYYHGCPGAPFTRTNYITIDSPKSIPVVTVPCSPAYWVAFGDSSMGDDTHLWSFSDGTTSALDNPFHSFGAGAVYTYTLSTYNAASGCRDTSWGAVDLRRPIPDFTASDTAICRDDNILLTATISGGTFSSLNYIWISPSGRLELGMSPTSPFITDTFHATGRFPVTLIVIDQNGCRDTVTKPNYILTAKPVARFTATPATGCWPLTVTFTDVSTGVAGTFMTSYYWAYGDGSLGTVTTAASTHTFVTAGTFSTNEIVTDNVGCRDTVSLSLVTVWRPAASFYVSTATPCINMPVTFTNTSTGGVTQHWSFGDGGTSTSVSPVHAYSATGLYTVQLAITDAHGCTDTATFVSLIHVANPHASFYMSDSASICPPLTVHFISTSTGASSYYWDLGDGSSSASSGPSNVYIIRKLDTIRLIITDINGCKDTAYGHVNVFGYAGAFQYTPDTGCAPLHVHFHATTLNVPNILWDYGDGATSTLSYTDVSTHDYTVPGKYIPKLILSNGTACKNSNVGLDTIKVDAIYTGFKIFPNPVCIGDTFMLADTSWSFFSTITSKNWSIDGNTSTADSPSFYIPSVGTYPATLNVVDGWGCPGTKTTNVVINPLPEIRATPDTVICVGDSATLYGYGGVSYIWSPPIALSCTACNPTYSKPPGVTTYTVTGTDAVGCVNWDTVTVSLRTKTTAVAHADTEICAGDPIMLYDSFATKFTWWPPVGLSSTTIANPIATLTATTKYTIIAQLGSCIADTDYIVVYVHPVPTVDAGPDQTVLEGETAQLNASGTLIQSYLWANAVTLSCSTCANPVASMSVATTYTVTASTNWGCKASDTVRIHILCDKSQLFIPNSFTPNHDGQNDKFYPRGVGIRIIKSFRIYNRWGQLLFERTNIALNDESNAWDGSYMGDIPHPDVYVYVIDAVCETGAPINVKGDVTIIR